MSPVRKNSDGEIVLTQAAALWIPVLIVIGTLLVSTGARWTANADALTIETRNRVVGDSTLASDIASMANDIKVIKATLLHCTADPLCKAGTP